MLEVKPLDAALGALVHGWNPKVELSSADEGIIRQGLHERQVLVFRGHAQPTDEELVRFAARFGNLIKGSEWFADVDPVPEILRVTNNVVDDEGMTKGIGGATAFGWHSDYSYVPAVSKESFLNAVEIPPHNPPKTYYCSQYAALERLPRAMVEMLRPLYAFHSVSVEGYGSSGAGGDAESDAEIEQTTDTAFADTDDFRKGFEAKGGRNQELEISRPPIPTAEHPVIMRHPDTGREILYASTWICRRVIGMPRDESDDLLKELTAHSTRPEFVYAHEWEVPDMVMFDVLGTLHSRDAWNPSGRREMRQLSTLWTPPAKFRYGAGEISRAW